jgi:acyl-CoA dehydrogenase
MDFELSAKIKELQLQLQSFMDAHVYPNENRFHEEVERE